MNVKDGQAQRSSLRDLAFVFFRRKWVIVALLLATVIPVMIYTLQLPDIYKTKARLLIKPGRENIYVSPVGAPEGTHPPTIVQRVREVINSEIEILMSRILLERVVGDMGVSRFDPSIKTGRPGGSETVGVEVANTINRVLPALSAEPVEQTDVIEIAFESKDPQLSYDFVNQWIDRFMERHVEVHQSGQSFGFFKVQADQLKQSLITSARQLSDFEKKYSIVSFDEQKSLVLQKYMTVDAEKKEAIAILEGNKKKIEKLEAEKAGLSKTRYQQQQEFTESSITGNLQQRLAQLKLERTELQHKYKPDNFNIVRLNDTISQLEQMLAKEEERFKGQVTTGLNPNYQRIEFDLVVLESEMEATQARIKELDKYLIEYGKELERLGRLEPELRSLKRNVSTNEQTYKLYLTKFEESRVSEAMDAAKMVSVSILEPPVFPDRPLPGDALLNLLVSLCLGGVAGLGFAFLLEYFDHTIKVPEDFEDVLGIPALGAIGEVAEGDLLDLRALAAAPIAPPPYENLKGNIKTEAGKKQAKLFCLAAATEAEGASTLVANLAAAFAKDNGQRVLLVDGNVRSPHLHSSFNLPMSPGFSDVVLNGGDLMSAVKKTAIPNLSVLTCGTIPENPMGLFEAPQLKNFMASVKDQFDWILFDGASVNAYPDTSALASKTDATILVAQAENKRAEVVAQAKESLEKAGGVILGAVLNRRRFIIPEAIYRRL